VNPSLTSAPARPLRLLLRSSLRFGPLALSCALAVSAGPALAQQPAAAPPPAAAGAAPPAAGAPAPGARKRRQPPPAVIPTAETQAAEQLFRSGRYDAAVAQAKAALNKNERYTPAMLVMAKAYYKLGKYEWTRKLWEVMQASGASDPEKAEIYQLLAFLEIQQKNTPGAIELLRKAADARPDNAVIWNNLGAQYLGAKNYKEATPALEKAAQLQPGFAKAHLNLGSAYRGVRDYQRAQGEYQRALQLFPNYADAVFNLGILYLDAEKMPNVDTVAKLNTAISYFQKYKQMMGSTLPPGDQADAYVLEAQDKIGKEQKRIERQRKAEERDRQRAAQKAAPPAAAPAAAPPAGAGAAPPPAPPAAPPPPPPPQR
jgi:tetratricopeptide (TPR) repeat protein